MTRLIPVIASVLILSVSLPAVTSADQTRSLTLDDRHRYDVPAARGDARAQTALGLRFAGHKTADSDTTAFEWFKRAAEQGDAEAQILLSGLFATGRGVAKDYVAAYKWAYLSGLRATEPEIIVNASNMIGVLNRQMSDEEIDNARQQAIAWSPKPEIVQTATTDPTALPGPAPAKAEAPTPVQPVAPVPVTTAHAEPAKVAPAAAAPAVDAPAPVVPVAEAPAAAEAGAEPQVVAKVEPQASAAVPGKAVSSKQAERRTVKRAAAKAKPRTRSVRNADYDQLIGTALSYARAYGIHLGGWQF